MPNFMTIVKVGHDNVSKQEVTSKQAG